MCGWLLTSISWFVVIITLPFSLCVCFMLFKSMKELSSSDLDVCSMGVPKDLEYFLCYPALNRIKKLISGQSLWVFLLRKC